MCARTVRRSIAALVAVTVTVCGFWLILARPAAGAAPRTLFVATNGSGTACIQSAPCALSSAISLALDGDTLFVAGGTYHGTGGAVIEVTRSITLYGSWNGSPTGPIVRDRAAFLAILDGEGARRVVYVHDTPTFAIDGFMITNGNATTAPEPCNGGGIYASQTVPSITNNTIFSNMACMGTTDPAWGYGGGIFIEDAPAAALIKGNDIVTNVANQTGHGAGGGIALRNAPSTEVSRNVISGNYAAIGGAGFGGGLSVGYSQSVDVSWNQIEGNFASYGTTTEWGYGGAVHLEYSKWAWVYRNHIVSNVASMSGVGFGGAVNVIWSYLATIRGNWMLANAATRSTDHRGDGGAVRAYDSQSLELLGNYMMGNSAGESQGRGGAIMADRNVSFRMENNIVAVNGAGFGGGGLCLFATAEQPVTGTLQNNTFAENYFGAGAGNVAIWSENDHVTLSIVDNLFTTHSAAVSLPPGSSADMWGNLFYANDIADTTGGGEFMNPIYISGQDPLLQSNLHLSAGSPAIGAGIYCALLNDIDGDEREIDVGCDIGADEYTEPRLAFVPMVRLR